MPRQPNDKDIALVKLWERRKFYTALQAQSIRAEKCSICNERTWKWNVYGKKICDECKTTQLLPAASSGESAA